MRSEGAVKYEKNEVNNHNVDRNYAFSWMW